MIWRLVFFLTFAAGADALGMERRRPGSAFLGVIFVKLLYDQLSCRPASTPSVMVALSPP